MLSKSYLKKKSFDIVLILAAFALAVYGLASMINPSKVDSSTENLPAETEEPFRLSGEVRTASNPAGVDPGIVKTISDYTTSYYESLAKLEAQDLKQYFQEGTPRADFDQSYTETMVDLRKQQPTNLLINQYDIGLHFTEIAQESEDTLKVSVVENQNLNFALTPDTTSESIIKSTFSLKKQGDSYKITDHYRTEDYYVLLQEKVEKAGMDKGTLDTLRRDFLNRSQAAIDNQKNNRNTLEEKSVTTQTGNYNREAAKAYADRYALSRNTETYIDFSEYGGNCNNFISQCILNGKLPEDNVGEYQWYHEDDGTASWRGVPEFYNYVTNNTDGGFNAEVSNNLYSGEVGDIIQNGDEGNFRHSVIITGVIENRNGKVIDYLVSSNSVDRKDYPLSAYGYPEFRLIHITGTK